MKVLGYMILHYGKPYLKAALEALSPQVEKIIILYTPIPSQGRDPGIDCPDSFADLHLECEGIDNIEWVIGSWPHEGAHCDAIWEHAKGYDWVIRIDSDEVVYPNAVKQWISVAERSQNKRYSIPFLHFWRSFGRVCFDHFRPIRLQRVEGGDGDGHLNAVQPMLHFGYCQPTKYLEYKFEVSGHHNEFRPGWIENTWKACAAKDVHPVVIGLWDPASFDRNELPAILKSHPYFHKDVVE